MNEQLASAEQTMAIAAAKAPASVESFVPYLKAAIAYWRLKEEAAQEVEDMDRHVEAVTHRLTLEERFREVVGRDYHASTDAISLVDAEALPEPK
jgi:hypothetical protein